MALQAGTSSRDGELSRGKSAAGRRRTPGDGARRGCVLVAGAMVALGGLLGLAACSPDTTLLEGHHADDGGTSTVEHPDASAAGRSGSGGKSGGTLGASGGAPAGGTGGQGAVDASPIDPGGSGGERAASGGAPGSGTGGTQGLDGGTGGPATDGGTAGGTGGAGGGVTKPPASGGAPGTGGMSAVGGMSGSGGLVATGGRMATGGVTGSAGAGGKIGTGGAPATGGAGGASASAATLSIDFVGGVVAGTIVIPALSMAPTESAGVKPAKNWNSAFGNSSSLDGLNLADGTMTTAAAVWDCPPSTGSTGVWRVNYLDNPGDTRMMNGYIDPTSTTSPAKVTVSNLPPPFSTRGYDVYVYVVGEIPDSGTRGGKYAIGSTTATVTQTGPTPTAFTGFKLAPANGAGNYVVFHGVTGASFTLTATPSSGNPPRAPVNGLQIVSPPGS